MSSVRGVFDPETITILSAAFDEAWLALPPVQHTPTMRSALAERILRKAGEGERIDKAENLLLAGFGRDGV